MKLFRTLAALAVLAFTLPALAGGTGAYSAYTYTAALTSGNALTTETIDARDLESLTIVFSAATADRVATVNCLAADGTTSLFSFPTVTAAFAGQAQQTILIRPDVPVPGTAPTGTTIWNVSLCPKMNVVVATAAGTGQIDIVGRREQGNAHVTRTVYESGSVTAGAALASDVIDTRRLESMMVLVEATTTNRALVVSCTDSAGTVLFNYASLTVTAANKYMRLIRADSPIPGTEATNVVHFPLELCRYMKATVAAAGAASAKLAVYTRS